MKTDNLRHDLAARVSSAWDAVTESVSDGWERLRRSTAGALTRFRPHAEDDGAAAAPGQGWAMLGGDVFEDDRRVIVRLEAPGLQKGDFDVRVIGDTLVVRGEKRFERESKDGRWRVLQCAYGAFERRVPLPAPVHGDDARARYRDGVLRIELPKASPRPLRRLRVDVR